MREGGCLTACQNGEHSSAEWGNLQLKTHCPYAITQYVELLDFCSQSAGTLTSCVEEEEDAEKVISKESIGNLRMGESA